MERLHEGVVEIEVDGETVELKPTPHALAKIDEHFDGLAPAAAAIDRSSPRAIAAVIVAGAGVSGKDARELHEKVMRPGYGRFVEPAGQFLAYLFNGGRETPPESSGEEGNG